VDLISYRITQRTPAFKIEEAAVGSGDKCGATYVEKVGVNLSLLYNSLTVTLGISALVGTVDWTTSFRENSEGENPARKSTTKQFRNHQGMLIFPK
jgi:hypothetical protein